MDYLATTRSERDTTSAPPSSMSPEEARERTDSIKSSVNAIRGHLVEMMTRQGWVALGYGSWHEYLVTEFPDTNHTYLRRQTNAGLLEASMGIEVGLVKESHLRPIIETLGDDDAAIKLAYHNTIWMQEEPTAKDFLNSARMLYVFTNGTQRVAERMDDGELSINAAYEISRFIHERDDNELALVAQECSDTELLPMLELIKSRGLDTWDEIYHSGCIPAFPEPLPLSRATSASLASWLDVASAEHRASAIEQYKENRTSLWDAIENLLVLVDRSDDVSVTIRDAALAVRSIMVSKNVRNSR